MRDSMSVGRSNAQGGNAVPPKTYGEKCSSASRRAFRCSPPTWSIELAMEITLAPFRTFAPAVRRLDQGRDEMRRSSLCAHPEARSIQEGSSCLRASVAPSTSGSFHLFEPGVFEGEL